MADTDPHEYWRAVYDARNAAGWRARADELRQEADICDARALSPATGIIQGSAPRPDIGVVDVQPAERQLVDDVVRDLVSRYPGTVQAVSLPTPDTAMVRLHRGDSTWLVSIARLEVSNAT